MRKSAAHQSGLTFIELMVTLVVLGIMVSYAITSYTDYTVRARVTEAFAFAMEPKNSFAEYYIVSGRMPVDLAQAGVSHDLPGRKKIESKYVDRINYRRTGNDQRGIMTVWVQNLPGIAGNYAFQVNMQGDPRRVRWDCTNTPTRATNQLRPVYLPRTCRDLTRWNFSD